LTVAGYVECITNSKSDTRSGSRFCNMWGVNLSTRPTKSAGRVVSFRLTSEELAALERVEREHGFRNRNDALRGIIRAAGGLLYADQEQVDLWRNAVRVAGQAGNNINQLARAANIDRIIWGSSAEADFDEVRKSCAIITRMFKTFAEASRGRRASKPVIAAAIRQASSND